MAAFEKRDPEAVAICAFACQEESSDPWLESKRVEIMAALESTAARDAQCAYLLAYFSEERLVQILQDASEQDMMSSVASGDLLQEIERVFRLYENAAQLDSIPAIDRLIDVCLGDYKLPEGLREKYIDKKRGIEWMKVKASLGDARTALHLGGFFLEGKHTFPGSRELEGVQDTQEAIKWLECGATNYIDGYYLSSVKPCVTDLMFIYSRDEYGVANLTQFLKWCNVGIKLEIRECYLGLGFLYLYGLLGAQRDEQRADHYFRRLLGGGFANDGNEDLGSVAFTIARDIQFHCRKTHPDSQIALQHYVEWLLRAIALGERNGNAAISLQHLFEGRDNDTFSMDIHHAGLARQFQEITDKIREPIAEWSGPSSEEIMFLARECYVALGLPVVEDEFLMNPHALPLEEVEEAKELEEKSADTAAAISRSGR